MSLQLIIETAAAMVKEHGAVPIDGTLRACYGPSGELYCLPIYVINPPEKYGTANVLSVPENIAGEKIKVRRIMRVVEVGSYGQDVSG